VRPERPSAGGTPAGWLSLPEGGPVSVPLGVGRECGKLRGVWGQRSPGPTPRDPFVVLQVLVPEADRPAALPARLEHHSSPSRPRVNGLAHLVDTVLQAHRVVIGHHPLVRDTQDRPRVVPAPQRPVAALGLAGGTVKRRLHSRINGPRASALAWGRLRTPARRLFWTQRSWAVAQKRSTRPWDWGPWARS
jgi:hypothetical protein